MIPYCLPLGVTPARRYPNVRERRSNEGLKALISYFSDLLIPGSHEFNAAIPRASLFGVIRSDGVLLTIPRRFQH